MSRCPAGCQWGLDEQILVGGLLGGLSELARAVRERVYHAVPTGAPRRRYVGAAGFNVTWRGPRLALICELGTLNMTSVLQYNTTHQQQHLHERRASLGELGPFTTRDS